MGLIAKSLLFSPKMAQYKEGVHWADVNASLYTPIQQGIVMLKKSEEIKKFYDFILGKKAKEIFRSYGYITP